MNLMCICIFYTFNKGGSWERQRAADLNVSLIFEFIYMETKSQSMEKEKKEEDTHTLRVLKIYEIKKSGNFTTVCLFLPLCLSCSVSLPFVVRCSGTMVSFPHI